MSFLGDKQGVPLEYIYQRPTKNPILGGKLNGVVFHFILYVLRITFTK